MSSNKAFLVTSSGVTVGYMLTLTAFSAFSAFLGAKMIQNNFDGYDEVIASKVGAVGGASLGAIIGPCVGLAYACMLDSTSTGAKSDSSEYSGMCLFISMAVLAVIANCLGHGIQNSLGNDTLDTIGMQSAAAAAGAVPAGLVIAFSGGIIAGCGVLACLIAQKNDEDRQQRQPVTDLFSIAVVGDNSRTVAKNQNNAKTAAKSSATLRATTV